MVTLKDVAKKANVSLGTASKVINNIPVKPQTKLAVDKAIKELNYEINTYARGLKKNKTDLVALILPTIWHPYFSELTYYIEKKLSEKNLKLLICNSEGDYRKELQYIMNVKKNMVDGIIAITYSDIELFSELNIPLVSIDRMFDEAGSYVSSDNYAGGQLAAAKLIEAGCENICVIGEVSKKNSTTKLRYDGFIQYCKDDKIPYGLCYNVGHRGDFSEELEKFLVESFVEQRLFQGIFAVTDNYANQIIEILNRYQVKVPEDVQIIGFDGSRSSKNEKIRLSTIRQNVELLATTAVELLIDAITTDNNVQAKKIIPVDFIQGETTKN